MAERIMPTPRRAGRYSAGAVLCAIINNVVLIGGDAAGLPDIVSVVLTWLIGGTVGYVWHYRLTFAAAGSWRGYAQFMAGVVLAIPLTYLALALFHGAMGWPMWLAAPAATVVLIPYNYLNAWLAILCRSFVAKRT